MTKKTAQELKTKINARLSAPGGCREARLELASLLANYLHETKSYRGFGYVEQNREGVREYHAFLDRERAKASYGGDAYDAEYKRVYAAAFGDDSRVFYY